MPAPDSNTPINETDDGPLDFDQHEESLEAKVARLEALVERKSRHQAELGPGSEPDPFQRVIWGIVRLTRYNTDIITFDVFLGLFKLVFVVNIPPDGQDRAKIYMKFRLNKGQESYANRGDDHNDRNDRSDRPYNRD